jgi:transcriptional regulator with XRE-family HTH domain
VNSFGDKLKTLRTNRKLTIEELVSSLNKKYDTKLSKSSVSRWENGEADPKLEFVRILSDYFEVPGHHFIDDMKFNKDISASKKTLPELNSKDERDIQKELQRMIDGLGGNNAYAAFDGETVEDMDEEDRELLISSLENSLRLAKRLAKQKFTPNKYRE